MGAPRYAYEDLLAFATALGQACGLAEDRAATHARVLLEADLMGHTTHGLALLGGYLASLEAGRYAARGEPTVVADSGSAMVWDGNLLPGTWLATHAIETAAARLSAHPVVTVCIKRSAHICCLAAYLLPATERGHVVLIMNSDPSARTVAAFGGIEPVVTPNPMAFGIPTENDPILVDISTSTTANGWVRRHHAEGTRLPGKWLLDAAGRPTDEPAALFTDPPGSVLPLGGTEVGYKGFGLALLVEALTAALTGFGRADAPSGQGSPVFIQLIDPGAFGGRSAFVRETTWLAEAARRSRVRPGAPAVRLPGQRGLELRRRRLAEGVDLHASIMPALDPWSQKLGVAPPAAL